MASNYTHYRFAHTVLEKLPDSIKNEIKKGIQLYDIGLHGPDIFFYYRPFIKNKITLFGHGMHKQNALSFFKSCRKTLSKQPDDYNLKAYIAGFITHFMLDSSVHGYIENEIKKGKVAHVEMEVEFDRNLMIEDGFNPVTKDLTSHINDSLCNARTISKVIRIFSPDEIRKALSSMKFYNKVLIAKTHFKRFLINSTFKLTGHYKELKGLMIGLKPNPLCVDTNKELRRRYEDAVAPTIKIITDYFLSNKSLSDRFNRTFSAKGNQ